MYILKTDVSFGTEMKFKVERRIDYPCIPGVVEIFVKVAGYPHHQFAILVNYPVIDF